MGTGILHEFVHQAGIFGLMLPGMAAAHVARHRLATIQPERFDL
ncbi:hypothetical protein SFMTTN_3110 [Sulfuriferula multivorans]|uniref:Uncharacterized protein n=1 Tax=Sulfuriferula multivorans TaxID=1559896 RepID=A0A401JH20_9PROT|nr:hypothetical protein SFMTTN_3110 [Sulfuriferula multivorans]